MKPSLAYGQSVDKLDLVLIQDNRGSQGILRSMISSFRVRRLRVYERADDAIKDMMMDPPNVVVTDWEMKPMSGYRLTRLVRNRGMEPLCYVPILVVAGNVTMTVVDRAFSAGVNAVIVKPVAPVVLHRRLDWLTRDPRGFVPKGESVVIDGMEEVLETRVRRNEFADLLRRQRLMQDALATQAQDAQEMVDRIVNGEVDIEAASGDLPTPHPARQRDTWNSWVMN